MGFLGTGADGLLWSERPIPRKPGRSGLLLAVVPAVLVLLTGILFLVLAPGPAVLTQSLLLIVLAVLAAGGIAAYLVLNTAPSHSYRKNNGPGCCPPVAGTTTLRARLLRPGTVSRHGGDFDLLVAALDNSDQVVVYEAAEALGRTGDERAVQPLIEVLSGEGTGGVRWKASEALARIGPAASGPLADLLARHADPDVRWKAAFALGEIGDEKAVSALIATLSDDDRFVRTRAAHALSRLGSGIYPTLAHALTLPDPAARQGAAEALGRLGDPRATIPLLAAIGGDPSDEVRSSASCAFGTLHDPVPVLARVLSEEPEGDDALVVIAAMRDPAAAEAVMLALENLDEPARASFDRALVRTGHQGIGELQAVAAGVCLIPDRRDRQGRNF